MASIPTFQDLVSRFGPNAALALMRIFGDGDTFSKGLAGGQIGAGALQAASSVSAPVASQVGTVLPYLGPALSAAGLGYGLTGIAKSTMPVKKKVGHSVDAAVAAAVPYYGLAKVADYVFGKLQQSGSPQQRRFGQTLAAPTLPVQALLSVFKGDQSPRAAATGMWEGSLRALGLGGYKPTTGTMFRHELGSIFDKIPQLKGTDLSKYNMPTGGYGQYAPGVFDQAKQAGTAFAGRTADAAKNPDSYNLQAANILLSKYGNQLPQVLQQMLKG